MKEKEKRRIFKITYF